MKLSEAIRKGCEIIPTKTKMLYIGKNGETACALGAAGVAVGIPKMEISSEKLAKHFPSLVDSRTGYATKLFAEITDMNDLSDMTREQIADELEKRGM